MEGTTEVVTRKPRAKKPPVQPLPYEQREWLRLAEIPDYMVHFYNLKIGIATVYRWRDQGMYKKGQEHLPPEQRDKIVLLASKRGSRWFVKRTDLEAFLNVT